MKYMYFIMKEKEGHETCKECLSLMLDLDMQFELCSLNWR